MAKLSQIQSVANVKSSFTYVTSDLLDEESIVNARAEMKSSQSKRWCRSLGAVINEASCSLEKAKSYSIKASANIQAKSVVVTIFCNPIDAKEQIEAHPTAKPTETLQDALISAKADVA